MSDRSSLRDAIQQALAAYDRQRSVDVAVGAIDDGSASIEDLYRVLSEILVRAGADWEQGTVEVWQEHFATGVVRNIVEVSCPRWRRQHPMALSIVVRLLRSSLGQTSLIIAGIGVGIAVVIFVGSLITSLQSDLIDTTVGSSPQIVLQQPRPTARTLVGRPGSAPVVIPTRL